METTTEQEPQTTSFFGRLINVIASPGEAFDDIRNHPPSTLNWLVPVMLMAVVGVISVVITFSQPSIKQQLKEQIAADFQKAVDEGKMPQSQADQMLENPQMATFGMIFGMVAVAVFSFIGTLWSALIVWLIGAYALKLPVGYKRALEIAGLSTLIITVGFIISLFLVMIRGNMWAKAAPSIFLTSFDANNKLHLALAALNLFYIWSTAIMAFGLARVGGGSVAKAVSWVFGYWIIIRVILIAVGQGKLVI